MVESRWRCLLFFSNYIKMYVKKKQTCELKIQKIKIQIRFVKEVAFCANWKMIMYRCSSTIKANYFIINIYKCSNILKLVRFCLYKFLQHLHMRISSSYYNVMGITLKTEHTGRELPLRTTSPVKTSWSSCS